MNWLFVTPMTQRMLMKKIVGFTLVLLGVVSFTFAQVPTEKTLLWEISGKDTREPSYLYGTIHLMCPQDLKVDQVVKDKFNATKELFLEIKTDDPNMMMEMMSGLKMKDSSTLKGMMGKTNFDSVSNLFQKSTGIPLEMLNTAKPILVISMVYPSLLGCTPDSWEKTFENLAKERSMPLKGLEKLSDQMKVLESIPYKLQADMLLKMMYNLDSAKNTFLTMLDIYKAKDLPGLYAMTTSDADFGQYEGAMLVDRNRSWIPVIKEQAKKTPTFFACGAAHLGGKDGLISLLRREGYTVKPVMY